jgi:hypothetical protein
MQTLHKLIYCCSTDCKISRFTVAKKKKRGRKTVSFHFHFGKVTDESYAANKAAFKIFAEEPSNFQAESGQTMSPMDIGKSPLHSGQGNPTSAHGRNFPKWNNWP